MDTDPMKPPVSVAICIATHSRPTALRNLLKSIDALVDTMPDGTKIDIRLAVIDNDPGHSAAAVLSEPRRFPLAHREDPQRGYASIRNATVNLAGASVEWLAFVDDDEVVSKTWLVELMVAALESRAAVVSGCVVSLDSTGVETHRSTARDFTPGRSDVALDRAHTDNLLVSATSFHDASGFNLDFDITGGEDIDLTHRIQRAGGLIVFTPDALVKAIDHPGRRTLRYSLRRGYAGNHNYSRVRRANRKLPQISRVVAGLARIVQGSGLALVGAIHRDNNTTMEAVATIGGGFGTIMGTFDVFRIAWSPENRRTIT